MTAPPSDRTRTGRPRIRRPRATVALAAASAVALAAAGCGGSSSAASSAPHGAAISIGLLLTLSGDYQALGNDSRDGFQLYLQTHDSVLGGHPVNVTIEDEGSTKDTAAAAAQRLLYAHVQAIVGPLSGASFAGVVPITSAAKVPIVGVAARPDINGDIGYVWNVSFLSGDPGAAVAPYIYQHVKGPVYAIGADYQGAWEQIRGFTRTFLQAGGKLANPGGAPTFTPFPTTTDFRPYLTAIKASGAKAIYCFYAGQQAVDFVKQYAASDASGIPLYAAGFLTEGQVLKAEGASATGITSVLDYSADVDTAANRSFVAAWGAAHNGDQPTVFSLTGYDAAALLDQAIAKAGPNPTPDSINAAISRLGRIDSPRGAWQMAASTHAPVQKWYLRRVQMDGTALANVKIEELATLGG